jgi:GntR family transcriptional regulator
VRGTSLSSQAQDILAERIKSGQYPADTQIPPENELAAEFNISRATVRSAISALVERGLVVRRPGVGTFVSRVANIANPLSEAEDFSYLIARNGYQPGVEFVRVEAVAAEAPLAEALGVPPGHTVLRSYKVFTADGEPVIYSINAIPRAVLGEATLQEALANPDIIEPMFDLLETRCNERTQYHVASLRADLARNCPFPDLPLEPGTPLLYMKEVGYNPGGRALWHSDVYFPGSHMTFELVRHRVRG